MSERFSDRDHHGSSGEATEAPPRSPETPAGQNAVVLCGVLPTSLRAIRRHDPGASITRTAELARTTVRALRYYEELGLLAPMRTPGNKRLFSRDQVEQARTIAELRRLGVGIQEIGAILSPTEDGDRGPVIAVIRERLTDLRQQVVELEARLLGLVESS